MGARTGGGEAGRDAVSADFQFHLQIMRATKNRHYTNLMMTLGTMMIPRARLDPDESRCCVRVVSEEAPALS